MIIRLEVHCVPRKRVLRLKPSKPKRMMIRLEARYAPRERALRLKPSKPKRMMIRQSYSLVLNHPIPERHSPLLPGFLYIL